MEKSKFTAIGLDEKTVESFAKNKKVVAKLTSIIEIAGDKATKQQGILLYNLATKVPPTQDGYLPTFVAFVMSSKWTRVN